MSEGKRITLLKAAKELNIGIGTAVDFLAKSGYEVEPKPATKLDSETYDVLLREFQGDKIVKEEANQIIIGKIRREESPAETVVPKPRRESEAEEILIKNTGSFIPEERKEVESPKPEPGQEKPEQPAVTDEEPPHTRMIIDVKIDSTNLKIGCIAYLKAIEDDTKSAEEATKEKKEAPRYADVKPPVLETSAEQSAMGAPGKNKDKPAAAA